MTDRKTTTPLVITLAALALGACDQTDVRNRGTEAAPGEEREASGAMRAVEPVELDTIAWFNEGRTVEFEGRSYVMAGEPLHDPSVEYVGEFEGTPLYGKVAVAGNHAQLFIPLENDYWQLLERGVGTPTGDDTADGGLIDLR